MSTTLDSEEDLQTYLNSLNKDIDEGTDTMELVEAVKAFAGGDGDGEEAEASQNVLPNSCSDDETTLFVDQDGNYFFQEPMAKRATRSSKRVAATATTTSSNSSKKQIVKASTSATKPQTKTKIDKVNYVLLENESKTNEDTIVEIAEEKVRVYEFDENDASDDIPDDADFPMPDKVVRLKPNSTKANSNDAEHECTHCEYTTTKHYLLLRHLKVHSDDRPYKCSVCERGFKTNSSLQNHMNSHLGNKPHACKHCEMCFTTAGELVRHTRYRHTGEKPHKCSECDYASVELSKLRRHIRCHTGERPYQCPHCTYASPDTFKLKRHLRTHTGEKPYECDICHARFTQSNSLKAHRLIHSVGDKPIYQCKLCPTTCGRKTDLRLHVQKLHHSDHLIKCKRCGKELPDRYTYKMHIKTHEGEKCYRCKICPYASISMRHLESHMLIHTDEKPYVCELCNMTFRQQQLLKRHINLYHNKNYVAPEPREKTHSCPHCSRTFTHKGNLLRHMEVHDPDSNTRKEKLNLKLGRLTHLQTGETLIDEILYDEQESTEDDDQQQEFIDHEEKTIECDEDAFTAETFEIIEAIDEEFDEKPTVVRQSKRRGQQSKQEPVVDVQPVIKKCSVKEESKGTKIMALEVVDDEQYMVFEVIQCEEGDEDDGEGDVLNVASTSIKQLAVTKKSKTDIDNCFGFQEDREFIEIDDKKSNIQLLNIIDDDM